LDLHEIFREGWQWVSEEMIKFLWQYGSTPTDKMCVGGGVHCPIASSLVSFWFYVLRNAVVYYCKPE